MSTDVTLDATPDVTSQPRKIPPPLTQATALRIGLMPEQARIRFWGRVAAKHGFGRGMPYQFANTLYLALLEEERIKMQWPIKLTAKDDLEAQSAWAAQVRTLRQHLTRRIDEFDVAGTRGQFNLHAEIERRFLRHLRAQRILTDLNVERISSDIKLTLDRKLERNPRWRYATFANIVWYSLAPHLETREMLEPNGVWRMLKHMIGQVRRIDPRFQEMSPKQRRLERINFALAIYEATYRLIAEADSRDRRYLDYVANRLPVGPLERDPILALPVEPATTNNLEEALWIRAVAYDDLLKHTLLNCYCLMITNSPES